MGGDSKGNSTTFDRLFDQIMVANNTLLQGVEKNSGSIAIVLGTGVGAITLVQLFTSADPVGRCARFWKQLSSQVSFKVVCA